MWDALWLNGKLATMATGAPFGLIEAGAIATQDGRIAWVGAQSALPGAPAAQARVVHDLRGRLLTPGLVDCHNHAVYHGDALADFELLTQGGTRADMIASGGGVQGLVRQTRAASDEQIYAASAARVARLIAAGMTTLESKSGAGLDLATELRCLRIGRELGRKLPVRIVTTFLGAHGLAPEFRGRPDDYVDHLCRVVLPAAVAQGLVDQVDGFCDTTGFSHAQITRLFETARAHGLPVKLHAEQYRDYKAADLVAQFRGLSADHLEFAGESTIRAMAEADTVATLLPGAHWTMAETQRPPVALFRRHGVKMALATNCNPVSSHTCSPTMMMNMACRLFGLTTEEALAGFTRNGAKALGLLDSRGTLEVGKLADFAVWEVDKPGELAYRIADNPCREVVQAGRPVYRAHPIEFLG
ncbi:MAG TPA: imidazolonepropionase [Candidatus Dormibacteraeota bacterium]|nr:imidazolonepropionase [Candidatus Dormibacteraeota bacterium]